jgi:hypothetical protein
MLTRQLANSGMPLVQLGVFQHLSCPQAHDYISRETIIKLALQGVRSSDPGISLESVRCLHKQLVHLEPSLLRKFVRCPACAFVQSLGCDAGC